MTKRMVPSLSGSLLTISIEQQLGLVAEPRLIKRAIVVVSFGTTYPEPRRLGIESVEDRIEAAFPDYAVRRAFTSRMVITRLAQRDGILVDTERQALERLADEGFTEVIVQPLHIVAGEEYEKVQNAVRDFAGRKVFKTLALGRPLLYYFGQGEKPDDYLIAIKALKRQLESDDAVILMGHGGAHPANAGYAALQMKLGEVGLKDIFVYTVEGYPALGGAISLLRKKQRKRVCLVPFMLVAGDHAIHDMAGDGQESAKSLLTAAGFQVRVCMRGLGENPAIQDVYVQHVKDAIVARL